MFKNLNSGVLGHGMVAPGTFLLPAPATSEEEVRDLPYEVRLGMPIILVYNMSM